MKKEGAISFQALEVKQPIGNFYIGVIDADDLVSIAWADVQRIEKRDVEEFLGIQRELSDVRRIELEKYVNTVDATFPTGIILAISSANVEFDPKSGTMHVERNGQVAKIIDGQHRIAGLRAFTGDSFQTNVVIFVDMEIEDQAMVFATINLKQTRVSKSLAYNLFEYASLRSPQKTAHDIAKLLNQTKGPLFQRIKILGRAEPGQVSQSITQAAFVDRLLPLITTDADADRDTIKRKRDLRRAAPGSTLVFRDFFIDDQDASIARALHGYFAAAQERWPDAWSAQEQGAVLSRTTGFAALMRVLPFALQRIASQAVSTPSEHDFYSLFRASQLNDEDFNTGKYPPGTSGESGLANDLIRSLESHL